LRQAFHPHRHRITTRFDREFVGIDGSHRRSDEIYEVIRRECQRQGKCACEEATLEALKAPYRCYAPIQLGLANLPGVPATVAIDALRQHLNGLMERLAHIKVRRKEQGPLPYFVEAMFDHSITMVETEKRWIKKFIQQLEVKDAKS